jgi:hypothetical protein
MLVISKDLEDLGDKKKQFSKGKSERKTWFSLLSNRHWETNSPFTRTVT